MFLIDKESVGVKINGSDEEKPEKVDFNWKGNGSLELFERSEESLFVRFVFLVFFMVFLYRLSGLFFCKFHSEGLKYNSEYF